LEKFSYGINEALIMEITHAFYVFVMAFDASIQAFHKLLVFIPVIYGSARVQKFI
jgi:hypothetical protein